VPLDLDLAKLTVNLSKHSYKDPGPAEAAVGALGLTGFRWFSDTSTQVFSAADAGRLYLAFRGTEADNPIDWITDAQFAPAPGVLGTKVHSGFRDALDEIWNKVVPVVEAAGKPVVATGHSLGAALATLAAARLEDAGHQVAALHTYGQPRTGLGDFRREFESRLADVSYRFINHIDLVTRVPLLVQSYRHIGHRWYFDASGAVHPDASGWKIAVDDLKYRLAHFGRIKAIGLAPHDMSAYVRLVEGL
jgi:pimeloyl-ACP methyl ester carboxylesterase